ncbi:hypothetical protein LCGC14_0434860 [marine sediment metagenome]|uniref:Terminase small subunit n=1 Tax=marine sediment metagenome TaxID=412755 RepID=A0A0F9ST90_9ZZZZ
MCAKGINPIKKHKVKQAILRGESYKQALKTAGYSEATAKHSSGMSVVKCSKAEIIQELRESDITVDFIIKRLNEDRRLAIESKDNSVVVRVDELLGKIIGVFKDRIEGSLEVNFINEALNLRRQYQLN